MPYEVVQLQPVRCAFYRYCGDDPAPHDRAMERVLNWAKDRNLLPEVVHFYVAFPMDGPGTFGMAAYLPIERGERADGLVTFEYTPGGLYALYKGSQPWGETVYTAEEEMGRTWGAWTEANNYEADMERLVLQEHIVSARCVGQSFRNDPGFRIDWYLPIKQATGGL
jgi:DNA gyrase inhibitor GyrI